LTGPRKVYLFGLCSAEPSWLLDGAGSGRLATLGGLLQRGLWGRTRSFPGLFEGVTWPSFFTGVGPGRHGYHSGEQLACGSYDIFPCRAGDALKAPPFWEALSRAGRKVCVLDVPHAPRSRGLNGVQLAEWGAHDAEHEFSSWPPALADEVARTYGRHPWRASCDGDRRGGDFRGFAAQLVRAIHQKERLSRDFLARDDWDFFAQVFTEAHCVGHQCWHLADPAHPRHDPAEAARAGDPIGLVYRALDEALGRMLQEVEEDAVVLVLANPGMGPTFGAQHLLDRVLLQLGVAAPPRAGAQSIPLKTRAMGTLRRAWRALPAGLRERMDRQRRHARRVLEDQRPAHHRTIDPALSRCFMVGNTPTQGAIRVNLRGREPHGLIEPGAEFEAFCANLEKDLMDLVAAPSGRPLVKRVIRRERAFPGPMSERLPDLFIEWHDEVGVTAVRSDKIGRIDGRNRHCRSGDHRPGGLFIALGPGLPTGELGRTVSILDFAPTIAELLAVDLPGAEGRAIAEIVRSLAPALEPVDGSR
jgi:predicted AlkP superfamily phosphohydrolase/phosphomutase